MKVFLELLYKNSEGVRVVGLISLRIADMKMSELVTQKPESLRLSRFLATTRRTRIFGSFSDKFLACLPFLGFSNLKKIV